MIRQQNNNTATEVLKTEFRGLQDRLLGLEIKVDRILERLGAVALIQKDVEILRGDYGRVLMLVQELDKRVTRLETNLAQKDGAVNFLKWLAGFVGISNIIAFLAGLTYFFLRTID